MSSLKEVRFPGYKVNGTKSEISKKYNANTSFFSHSENINMMYSIILISNSRINFHPDALFVEVPYENDDKLVFTVSRPRENTSTIENDDMEGEAIENSLACLLLKREFRAIQALFTTLSRNTTSNIKTYSSKLIHVLRGILCLHFQHSHALLFFNNRSEFWYSSDIFHKLGNMMKQSFND